MSVTEQTIAVGSLKWFYREATSKGESSQLPTLFLHGLPSQSFSWCEIMPELAEKGINAIAPDWIGFGYSDKPSKRDFAYTPKAYVEALAAFIEAMELKKFHLVVQGFLGSVGLQYALQHPDAIERLVILNSPLSTDAKLPWKMQQVKIPLVGDMLTQDPLLAERLLEGGSGFVISDENLAVYRKPFLTASAAGRALMTTVKNLQLASSMTEINEGLRDWQKPLLIIWGMADPWLDSAAAESLAKARGNIELVKLEEAKHFPQEHWSKEISAEILAFLRRQAV